MKANDINEYIEFHNRCQRLWYQFAEGGDSSQIIETAYELVGNPVIINLCDVHYKAKGVQSTSLINDLFLLHSEKTELSPEKAAIHLPPFDNINDKQVQYGFVSTGIVSRGKLLGRVLILGENHPLSEHDCEVADILAKVWASLFSGDEFSKQNSKVPHMALFHSLITGNSFIPDLLFKNIFCPFPLLIVYKNNISFIQSINSAV